MKKAVVLLLIICLLFTACAVEIPSAINEHIYGVQREDLNGEWVDTISGNKLTITDEEIIYAQPNKKTSSYTSNWDFDGKFFVQKIGSMPFEKLEIVKNETGFILIADGFNFIKEDEYAKTITEISLGETAKTDKVEITVTKVEFAKLVSTYTYLPETGNGGLSAGDGQIYACVYFDVINLDKSKLDGSEIEIIVNYNDGYEYTSKEVTNDFILNGNKSNYSMIDLDPLVQYSGHGIIKCAEIVGKDNMAPLEIIVVLPTENGIERFVYKIR